MSIRSRTRPGPPASSGSSTAAASSPDSIGDSRASDPNPDRRWETATMADRDRGEFSRRAALQAAIGLVTIGAAERALGQQQQKIAQKAAQYPPTPKNGQTC